MTKKRWPVVFGVVLGVALGLAVVSWSLLLPGHQKTSLRAGYDRVQIGMTLKELHKIKHYPGFAPIPNNQEDEDSYIDELEGGHEIASFSFADGRVTGKNFRRESYEPIWLKTIRRRLGI
jgi:hypothetical protein